MKHTVIIPAKNEEENICGTIRDVVDVFERENTLFEICVINDYSTDNTKQVVKQVFYKDKRIRLIDNILLPGIGNAIAHALDCFDGDSVTIVMADGSDDPEDVLRFCKKIEEGYDCCFGTRFHKLSRVTGYPLHKLIINRIVNYFIKIFFGIKYNDCTNAFKSYSRETIDGIKPVLSHHFNITVELPLKAIIRGYNYAVLPNNWYGRKAGRSKLKLQEMGSRYFFIIIYAFVEKLLSKGDYKKGRLADYRKTMGEREEEL